MRRTLVPTLVATLVGLLLLATPAGSAFALPRCNSSPSEKDTNQALKHMAAGVSFIKAYDTDRPQDAQPEEGYPEFLKAYQLSCSLNALRNLALCAMKLELDQEAIEYYSEVLDKKTDLTEEERSEVKQHVSALKTSIAWLTLSSDRPGVKLTDVRTPRRGSAIRNLYDIGLQAKKIGIHPGNHTFTATVEGFPDKSWTVEIKNGSAQTHEFIFDPNAPVTAEGFTEQDQQGLTGEQPDESGDEGGGVPIYVYIAGGVTIAAAIPMAIFMAMSSSKKAEYDDEILGKKSIDEQQDAHDSLKTTNLLADVFLGVTAAGAAATVILFLTAPSGDDASAAKKRPRFGVDYTVVPMLDPGGGGAVVTARF